MALSWFCRERLLPAQTALNVKLSRWSAAEKQHEGSSTIGEEAEVTDARKASRQDLLHETA
jgi:hypothetical protein